MFRPPRLATLVLAGLLAGCTAPAPPAPPSEVGAAAIRPADAVTEARLALANALIAARATRIALYNRAMALPPDSPLRPTLADRADRLKRAERRATEAQAALHARPSPETAQRGRATAAWLTEMTGKLGA